MIKKKCHSTFVVADLRSQKKDLWRPTDAIQRCPRKRLKIWLTGLRGMLERRHLTRKEFLKVASRRLAFLTHSCGKVITTDIVKFDIFMYFLKGNVLSSALTWFWNIFTFQKGTDVCMNGRDVILWWRSVSKQAWNIFVMSLPRSRW